MAAGKGRDQYIVRLYENHAEVLTAGHSKEDTAAFLHAQGIEKADMRYQSGVMGVPITFLDKYCPEQFKIIGHEHDLTGNGSDGILVANLIFKA
nr:adenine-specific methyltransferase EcoRI family protein [Pseudoflavonifractor phocaeensis]